MTITAIIIDDQLSLADLAQSCGVTQEWIIERVQAGLLCTPPADLSQTRFTSTELTRARRLHNIERSFEANPELAALVVDMMEEIKRLRGQISRSEDNWVDL